MGPATTESTGPSSGHSRPGTHRQGNTATGRILLACARPPLDRLAAPPRAGAEYAGQGAPVNEDLCLQATSAPVSSRRVPILFKWKLADLPACLLCGGASESPAHIQCRCPALKDARIRVTTTCLNLAAKLWRRQWIAVTHGSARVTS